MQDSFELKKKKIFIHLCSNMSMIKEESDNMSDLETVAGYDIIDIDGKSSLRDVKPFDPNVPITSSSQNEGHKAYCVGPTASDLSAVTVKLEFVNVDDEKGCKVANYSASPSIPTYSGDNDEFKVSTSNTSKSVTIGQQKLPIPSVRTTIDDENWIEKEPCSSNPTDPSSTTIVIHSSVDHVVSGNADLENDIAGKPLYSNNTPSMEGDFKGVKREPAKLLLAEQQSRSKKPGVEEKQISEITSGKLIPKVIIQRLESNSNWMKYASCKNNVKSSNVKKTLHYIDLDTSSSRQKGNFACRICLKKYVYYSAVKKHMIQKHPQCRDLCALVQKDNEDLDNDSQCVWFCPRNCKYITFEHNALSEHLVTCQKTDLLTHSNKTGNMESGNNLSPSEYDKDHGGHTSAEGLMVLTQKTGQASSITGQVMEREMQTVDQDIDGIPTCQLCDSAFSTNLLLEGYMKDCHEEQHTSKHREAETFQLKCSRPKEQMQTHAGDNLFKYTHRNINKSFRSRRSRHLPGHKITHNGDKLFQFLCGHKRTNTGEKPFQCDHCNKSFSRRSHLHLHMRTHTGEKPFKCSNCNKSFIKKSYLHVHMRSHTGEKQFKCIQCNKRFSRRATLHVHMRTHTEEKPFKCSHCNKSYRRSCDLDVHMRTHTGEKPFKCSHCTKSFSQNINLLRHIRTHTGEKPFECSHCTKSFSQNFNLLRHIRTHTGEKPFECSHCTKSFSQSGDLHLHMRIHTGEKPFTCSHCTKSYRRSCDLHVHMRTHTGEKPFKCSHCTKSFSHNIDLLRHIRTHTGEKPFTCSHCNKSFRQNGDLHLHMRIHTGEKPFKCTQCNKSFRRSCDLPVHMRIHTGEKPFTCSHCNKSYRRSCDLHVHMRTHTVEKPLKCSHCNKSFS